MFSSAKILIVDDEPRMCESLKMLLSKDDYEIQTACSGLEALNLLRDEVFEVAILDMVLPDMSGLDLMEYINQKDFETDVIVMTGNATLDSAISALRKGAYDYLKKPFEIDQLKKTIKNALDQKRLRKEKNEINNKLVVSEEKYKYLVRNSPDIIYTLDAQGNFTFVSDAAEKLLGLDVSDLIGKHYSDFIPEEDLEKCKWFVHERRTGKRAANGVELRIKAKGNGNGNGSPGTRANYLTVELKSTGVYEQENGSSSKKFLGTHGVARDITLRKQMEAQLEQAARMESLGTLAGGIAHNFNNILMAIQGNASLCLLDIDPASKHYERLKNIVLYVENGARLTKQLIGFARGETYQAEPTDLNNLLHRSAELFAKTRKEITLHEDLERSLWAAETDQQQIEQVLMNIFVNAWHAMPDGGDLFLSTKNVTIEEGQIHQAQELPSGNYVRIRVRDTGTGMDEEVRQRIFEPFFTTKEVGQGTGLGMASAFGIIQNLGGAIQVESQKGKGTACDIFLPASSNGCLARTAEGAAEKIFKGNETLLLIDDEDMILQASQELFEELGYTVLTAGNGRDAIEIYKDRWQDIHLVILDLVMPGMDGKAVYQDLKKINQDMKCLLSTGHSIETQSAETLLRACDGYIYKPFNLEKISRKIREILD